MAAEGGLGNWDKGIYHGIFLGQYETPWGYK